MRKKVGIIKKNIAIFLIIAMSINSFAAIVSDNDGSAFITKAEFDALKSSFQSQIDSYNQSIDSKIDGAISSYLAGIKIQNQFQAENYIYKINKMKSTSTENPWQIKFSKGWTVPKTQIGDFIRFATGYTYVHGRVFDNGTKRSFGYNAVVRGTGGTTTIQAKTKGSIKTRMAQMTKDSLTNRYYWQHNLFYQSEPNATMAVTGWNSGHNATQQVWPTSLISGWKCTFSVATLSNANSNFKTQFGVSCTGTFSLSATCSEALDGSSGSYTLKGTYSTSIDDTILGLSSITNGKYINIFAGGVVVDGSVFGNTADKWQRTTPFEDPKLMISDEGLNLYQGPAYDNGTLLDKAVPVYISTSKATIEGGITYYGYNREYNTYYAKDLLFYEPYSITSKEVTYYSGCPMFSANDKGIAKIQLKFSAPSNTNFSFAIRNEAFTNVAGLDTTGIVSLYKNNELTISQPTSFTSTSMQDLTFYMHVEAGKTYWLKVIPTDANKDITVDSPEEYIVITKED